MSTRATVHFQSQGSTQAIVYRHSDGYPTGLGKDLKTFFSDVKKQVPNDSRFNDPCYLAAKFVVWQAERYEGHYTGPNTPKKSGGRLDFLSVGVLMKDPGDIEYRYLVACDNASAPKVKAEKV